MTRQRTQGQTAGLDIIIWSDVVCPWCPIAYTNLQKALDMLGGKIDVQISWHPFQLSPDIPPEGRTMRENFELITGKPFADAKPSLDRVAEAGRAAGFPIPLDEDPEGESMVWNSFAAHKLLRWALDTVGPERQCVLSLALFRANFQDQRNISDLAVLLDIVAETGLDRNAAKEAMADPALDQLVTWELQQGRDMGLSSVPTLVINRKYGIAGGQPPEVFAQALAQIVAEAAKGQNEG